MEKPQKLSYHWEGHIYLALNEFKNPHFLADQLPNLLQTTHSVIQCHTGVQKPNIIIYIFSGGVYCQRRTSPHDDQETKHKSRGLLKAPLARFFKIIIIDTTKI